MGELRRISRNYSRKRAKLLILKVEGSTLHEFVYRRHSFETVKALISWIL